MRHRSVSEGGEGGGGGGGVTGGGDSQGGPTEVRCQTIGCALLLPPSILMRSLCLSLCNVPRLCSSLESPSPFPSLCLPPPSSTDPKLVGESQGDRERARGAAAWMATHSLYVWCEQPQPPNSGDSVQRMTEHGVFEQSASRQNLDPERPLVQNILGFCS